MRQKSTISSPLAPAHVSPMTSSSVLQGLSSNTSSLIANPQVRQNPHLQLQLQLHQQQQSIQLPIPLTIPLQRNDSMRSQNISQQQQPIVDSLLQLQMRHDQSLQNQQQQQQISNIDDYIRSMNAPTMMSRNNTNPTDSLDRRTRGLKVPNNAASNKTWTDKQIVQ